MNSIPTTGAELESFHLAERPPERLVSKERLTSSQSTFEGAAKSVAGGDLIASHQQPVV